MMLNVRYNLRVVEAANGFYYLSSVILFNY